MSESSKLLEEIKDKRNFRVRQAKEISKGILNEEDAISQDDLMISRSMLSYSSSLNKETPNDAKTFISIPTIKSNKEFMKSDTYTEKRSSMIETNS